jgi:putative multiple sugar transport system substrate-binding protein
MHEQHFKNFPGVNALADVDFALKKGEKVDVNDTKTYDNDVKIVPSSSLIPISIDITNYQKELVDTDYITADQLK